MSSSVAPVSGAVCPVEYRQFIRTVQGYFYAHVMFFLFERNQQLAHDVEILPGQRNESEDSTDRTANEAADWSGR
jgi:hypothetical protein